MDNYNGLSPERTLELRVKADISLQETQDQSNIISDIVMLFNSGQEMVIDLDIQVVWLQIATIFSQAVKEYSVQ